ISELINVVKSISQRINELQSTVDSLGKKIEEKTSYLTNLRNQYNEVVKEIERSRVKSIVEHKKMIVEEKLKRGERRLTLEELQLLYGNVDELIESGS
ncbi:MAG: hypothetical protein QW164_04845, partial [Desulfurococcaceae archaeon]